MNRMTMVEQGGANGWIFGRSHYQYDKVGRETATWRDEDTGSGSGWGERFEYEVNDQVKKVFYNVQNAWTETPRNATNVQEYGYSADKLNRTSVSNNGVTTGYTMPDGMNQYTNVGNQAIGYDNHFNIASYNGLTFSYDAENHLVGGSMQATYDGLGRCVRRTVGGQTQLMTYDGWKPILEWVDWGGGWLAWNVYGAGADEILARNDWAGRILIYKQDKQGSVAALLDGSGNVAEKYHYDVFGQPTVTDYWGNARTDGSGKPASWCGNRFMFTGREWIGALGLYDYRHRMYHPGLGRFLQADPMGLQTEGEKLSAGQKALFSPGGSPPEAFSSSEMNLYRYCGDDPVDKSDPTGLDLIPSVESVIVSTAVGVGAHLFLTAAQALGYQPDDQAMHFQTSRLMTEFGDPVTTYVLGEAKEIQKPGRDTPIDRHSNHEGIKEGIRRQLGPLGRLLPQSHKRTTGQLLRKLEDQEKKKKPPKEEGDKRK